MVHPARKQPDPMRDFIVNLRIDDEHNTLPAPAGVELLRTHLERVLVDTYLRQQHTDLLKELYQAPFLVPRPRRELPEGAQPSSPTETVFRHHQLLPEQLALDVGQRGLAALDAAQLARLALNPFALWDLADLIEETLPDYWLDRMEVRGGELMREMGVDVEDIVGEPRYADHDLPQEAPKGRMASTMRGTGAEAATGQETNAWLLGFGTNPALARRMAEALYNDPNKPFELKLFKRQAPDDPKLLEFELEVSPSPTRGDLTVAVLFPAGERRTFTLEVPPELKIDPTAKPRAAMRSEPCDPPIAAATCSLQGEPRWKENTWPPELDWRVK
jgi:hypothetical protein